VKDRLAIVQGIRRAFRLCALLKTYLVRKAANCEVVGLFVASSLRFLAALVDECCDPSICEYAEAYSGGLFILAATEATWPLAAGTEASGLEGAVLSQQWQEDLSSGSGVLQWKSLAAAARRMIRGLDKAAKPGGEMPMPMPMPQSVQDRRRTGR
jgi:hypothetical protein